MEEFAKIDIPSSFDSFGDSAKCALIEIQLMIKAVDDPNAVKLKQRIRVKDSKGLKSDSQEEGLVVIEDGVITIAAISGGKDAQPDKSLRTLWTVGMWITGAVAVGCAGIVL